MNLEALGQEISSWLAERGIVHSARIEQHGHLVIRVNQHDNVPKASPEEFGRNRDPVTGKVKITKDQLIEVFRDNPGKILKAYHVADILLDYHSPKERGAIATRLASLVEDSWHWGPDNSKVIDSYAPLERAMATTGTYSSRAEGNFRFNEK